MVDVFNVITSGLAKAGGLPAPAVVLAIKRCIEALQEEHSTEDDPIFTHVMTAVSDFLKYLPVAYWFNSSEFENAIEQRHGPSVPLHDLLTDLPKAIRETCAPFFYRPMTEEGYFPKLRKQLLQNENIISKISSVDRVLGRGKIIEIDEYDGTPYEIVEAYLHHTPLYELFTTPVRFSISKKALSEHCFIVAKPGHGKTQLLGSFVRQFFEDPSQPGVFCLDPAGDWFEIIRDRVDPARLVVLDPETDPPPLNFFDFKNSTEAESLQSFTYLMSSLSGGLSDKQGAIVPYLLKLLRRIPEASLETLRLIVDEKVKSPDKSQFASAIKALPTVDQGFFHSNWFHSSMEPTKSAMSWKIYSAMSSDAFCKMFTAKENSFDAHAAMRERKVVLARGSELTLGEHGLSVFLQYIVSRFFLASLARFRIPEKDRHQCYLICDEASHIYNNQIKRVLVECRKLGLSFFSATQLIDQIPTEVKAAVYTATSVKAAGNVSFSDANLLAREMRTSADFIQGMKTFEWAFFISDSDKAVKVVVPPGSLEAMPKQKAAPVQAPPPDSSSKKPEAINTPTLPQSPEDASTPGKGRL